MVVKLEMKLGDFWEKINPEKIRYFFDVNRQYISDSPPKNLQKLKK
jgi:hypothetical protein